jgi:dipeptidase E
VPLNLVMYSDQNAPGSDVVDERLVQMLVGRGKRVAYLPAEPDAERIWFNITARRYARLGLSLEYFGVEGEYEAARLEALLSCDAIHLSGGNTFRFLFWLRARKLLESLRAYAQNGVLVGVSAGAVLMTPDVATAALCGDARYANARDDTALGLVDFALLPHFDGAAALREHWLRYSSAFPAPVYAVPDGAGVVVTGNLIECVGPVSVALRGAPCD